MSEWNGNNTVLQHEPRCGRQLHVVVPVRPESERDVGHDVDAVLGGLNGVLGVQFNHRGISQTNRCTAVGREEERCLIGLAVHVKAMLSDGPADDLVRRFDGPPFLRGRENGRGVFHGSVLKKDGAGGLELNDFNGKAAPIVGHERHWDGLCPADVLHRCPRFVHTHHERGRSVSHEVVSCMVCRPQACQFCRSCARDLDSNFCERRPQYVNRVTDVPEGINESAQFLAVKVEQAGGRGVRCPVGNQRVLDEKRHVQNASRLSPVAESEGGQAGLRHPKFGITG